MWLTGFRSRRPAVPNATVFSGKSDVALIKSLGFDHLRLPIDEEQMWDENGVRHEDAFKLMTNCLDWCEKHQLKAIVDLHILRSHHFNAEVKPLWTDPEGHYCPEHHFHCRGDRWRFGACQCGRSKATGAFMRITARQSLRLVGTDSPAAGVTELHEMKMEGDVMKMRAVPGIGVARWSDRRAQARGLPRHVDGLESTADPG